MSPADRERLLDLCKREIYAKKLGAEYKHTDKDKEWWLNIRHNEHDEYIIVIRQAKVLYGYYEWREAQDAQLRSKSEAERCG